MADETQTLDGDGIESQTPAEPGKMMSPEPSGDALTPEEQEKLRIKFAESSKEALRLKAEQERLQAENEKLRADLTEKEFALNNPEYESMTEAEKQAVRLQEENRKDILELKAKNKWLEDYGNISGDIKTLIAKKGGEEAFKAFACKPENTGASLQTLAKAFVFDDVVKAPTPQQPKTGLEAAGSHQPIAKSKDGFTTEEAERIRKTDPAKYARLVREKRLKIID